MSNHFSSHQKIFLRQKKEIAELFGFETRNKYSIESENGDQLAFAGEDGKNIGSVIWRQIFGHWRPFSLRILNNDRSLIFTAVHPFGFIFQRLDVIGIDGRKIGSAQQRFSFLEKKFDLLDAEGVVIMKISTPIWKPWTFAITKNGLESALILKKWSGLLKEVFTDADNFTIDFKDKNLSENERRIIVAAALLIDIVYFEQKASN
ncbi:MAG: hypothetical protein K2Q18_13145 [Bdellovibrionales bacterium]|nr:hypothetical protein [Bdellovibrionales bacterium]